MCGNTNKLELYDSHDLGGSRPVRMKETRGNADW